MLNSIINLIKILRDRNISHTRSTKNEHLQEWDPQLTLWKKLYKVIFFRNLRFVLSNNLGCVLAYINGGYTLRLFYTFYYSLNKVLCRCRYHSDFFPLMVFEFIFSPSDELSLSSSSLEGSLTSNSCSELSPRGLPRGSDRGFDNASLSCF